MNIYIYGFQYGTFSAIVLGGQLQKNVWAMFGVFLGESPHFVAGFWQVFGASFPAASSKTIVCLKKSLQYMFRSFSANFSVTIVLIKHKCSWPFVSQRKHENKRNLYVWQLRQQYIFNMSLPRASSKQASQQLKSFHFLPPIFPRPALQKI